MPVKRRKAKRRTTLLAEARAWGDVFQTKFDYFGALAELGITHPADVWPPEARDWPAFHVTAEAAWHRLGEIFMETRGEASTATPWALEQFGEPRGDLCR